MGPPRRQAVRPVPALREGGCEGGARRPSRASRGSAPGVAAEGAVEPFPDAVEVVEHLDEAPSERIDALRDRADLPLELALVAVKGRALDVDHPAEATDEIDERIEPAGDAHKPLARVGESRRDLGDARFEAANALREKVARLG
jgi:hypothetical protein